MNNQQSFLQLREVYLQRFCGFEEFTLEVGDFTALIGPNNGGKTTILRAINFALDTVDLSYDAYEKQVREFEEKLVRHQKETDDVLKQILSQHEARRPQQNLKPHLDQVHQQDVPGRSQFEKDRTTQLSRLERERPQWECDLTHISKRQHVESLSQFFLNHSREASATVQLRFVVSNGSSILRIRLGLENRVKVTYEVDGVDHWELPPDERRTALQNLRGFSFLFMQPIGALAPSEQALSWPEVQKRLDEGRPHDVWRNEMHWLSEGKNPEAFQRVTSRIHQALDGVRVNPPGRTKEAKPKVVVTYQEGDGEHDISEAGAGLRTFLGVVAGVEMADARLLLFDEPDTHLHSAVQRQLAEFLECGALPYRQIIVASHAPDMIDQFSLDSIFWIDRTLKRARPCDDATKALVDIGAISHAHALEFATSDAFVYFENKPDRKVFEELLLRCGKGNLLARCQLADLKGVGDVKHLPGVARFIRDHHHKRLALAVLRDGDYMPTEETGEIDAAGLVCVHRLPCKEMENLLLLQPRAILEAARRVAQRRSDYTSKDVILPSEDALNAFIDDSTALKEVRDALENNWIAARLCGTADAGRLGQIRAEFEQMWSDSALRRRHCPGKLVLKKVKKWLQDEWSVSFSRISMLFEAYEPEADLQSIFDAIERHIQTQTTEQAGAPKP